VNGTIRRMMLSKPAVIVAVAAVLLCPVGLAADVTVSITTSIEGGLASGPSNNGMSPKVVTKISGTKSRTDVDMGDQVVTTIIDTESNQVYVLRPEEKTALLFPVDAVAAGQPAGPGIDAEVKPTGRTRDIDGVSCAEFSVMMRMNMAAVAAGAGSSLPPEATAMLKDVFLRVTGSTWVAKDAPGATDYAAFQKAAARAALSALSRAAGSGGASSPLPSGMERLFTGFPEATGIPYLTELTTAVEGTGQFVALLQGMAQMKVVSKVTGVSTETVAAEAFTVPEGYTVVKQ
jgi:hypothetical protein